MISSQYQENNQGETVEEGKEQSGIEQESGATKKSKFEKLLMGKKPDNNDGDVENFYSLDPSKQFKVK